MVYLQIDESSTAQCSDTPAAQIAADSQVVADWLKWFANETDETTGLRVYRAISIHTEIKLAEEIAPEKRTATWAICEATRNNGCAEFTFT